jgi:hypothetical protein
LETKLTRELQARKRELAALEAEKITVSRDVAQTSKDLESKLKAEKDAHTLALSKLKLEQEAHKRDLAANEQVRIHFVLRLACKSMAQETNTF